jgi:hypothetical protein
MKLTAPLFAVLFGVALGTAAGIGLRHSGVLRGNMVISASTTNSNAARPSSGSKVSSERKTHGPAQPAGELNLSMTKGVTRWLYWWDAIEKAGAADFPRLARLAQGNRVATRLVAERWAELAPKQFFEALRSAAKQGNKFSGEFADILFSSWLKKDKAAAIEALNGPENFPERNSWRQQVASTLMDSDPETGLKMMSQWHIENYGPNMKAVESWAKTDPRHAAEFTLGCPAGYASAQALRIIGEAWSKMDPAQALQFATAQRGDLGKSLADTVLKSWAERDLNQAADWLANADLATVKKLSPSFVEAWAKQDASAALAWCQANLAGSTLTESVRDLFNGAAQKDPAAAALTGCRCRSRQMVPQYVRKQAGPARNHCLALEPGSGFDPQRGGQSFLEMDRSRSVQPGRFSPILYQCHIFNVCVPEPCTIDGAKRPCGRSRLGKPFAGAIGHDGRRQRVWRMGRFAIRCRASVVQPIAPFGSSPGSVPHQPVAATGLGSTGG